LVLTVTLSGISTAQISVDGKPLSNDFQVKTDVETFTMPSFDVDKMLREDAFESQFKDIPPRFGKDFAVNFGYGNSGTTDVLPNGTKVWRVNINSPGAISIYQKVLLSLFTAKIKNKFLALILILIINRQMCFRRHLVRVRK
jgi:hypothetical protein